MRCQLPLQGKSQYDTSISPNYRNSACGPTTVHVILQYLGISTPSVNQLYEMLGSTKIGLFRWRFIRNLRKLLTHTGTFEHVRYKKLCRKLMPVALLRCALTVILACNGAIKNLPLPIIGYH